MKLCIDLDGVICKLRKDGQTYDQLEPIEGAVEKLKHLQENGHYIIINTARHMKTCNGNLGLVNARITKITLDWLEKNEIKFDEIYFGKPWADIYIDDNAFRFSNWDLIDGNASNLPISSEKKNSLSL